MSLRSHVSTPDDRSILRRLLFVSNARRIKDFHNSRLKRIFRRTYYDRPTFGRSSPFSYCFASTCIIVDGRPYKSKIERNAANLNSTRLGANPFGRGNRNNEASGRTATSIRSEGYVLTNRGIAPRHIFIQSPFGGAPTPRVEMRRVHREETRTLGFVSADYFPRSSRRQDLPTTFVSGVVSLHWANDRRRVARSTAESESLRATSPRK